MRNKNFEILLWQSMPYAAAILSGLLAALSFPTIFGGIALPNLSWLAWFALIPFFLAMETDRLPRAALAAFLLGVGWNGLTSYWIFNALYFNGQLGLVASLGVLAFMACVMGAILAGTLALGLAAHRRFRLPLLLVLPSAWALYEWLRNYLPFGGYPWANLGYSQAPWLTLIQSADLFGVYGLSFLIVFVNLALAKLLRACGSRRPLPWRELAAAGGLLLACLGYGAWRLPRVAASVERDPTLKVALLQPNIGQAMKGKPDLNEFILGLLTRMTRRAEEQAVDLIVWPESALPIALPLELQDYAPLSSFAAPVLMGVLSISPSSRPDRPLLYNSALQVDPGGRFAGRLHKQHLVPLGEYVPLPKLLWFVQPVAMKMGDFRTTEEPRLLSVAGRPYGVVICYEDLFPELSRAFTRLGARFLVNITNDAWYGDSSQLDQHLNFSRFRAVENRRALIRGTNNGYTAAIDPTGAIRAEIPKFIAGVLLAEIPLHTELTFYTRFGDGPWLGALALALLLSLRFRQGSPNRRREGPDVPVSSSPGR